MTAAVVLGLSPAVIRGQPQPRTFFKDHIKLQDTEIQKIEQGQVVTKVVESGDKKYGLLVFGAMYVDAPVARFAAAVKDIQGLLQNKVYLAVQEFSPNGAPPKSSDFDRIVLKQKDIDELRTCKPGDCDIQIFNVAELQKGVDWQAKDRDDQVNRLVRQNIDGLKGFGSYRDRQQPLNLYEATRSMIDLSYYLPKDKAGGIYRRASCE